MSADAERAAHLGQRGRHLQRMLAALHRAGAGDQGEGPVVGDLMIADADGAGAAISVIEGSAFGEDLGNVAAARSVHADARLVGHDIPGAFLHLGPALLRHDDQAVAVRIDDVVVAHLHSANVDRAVHAGERALIFDVVAVRGMGINREIQRPHIHGIAREAVDDRPGPRPRAPPDWR